MIGWTNLRKKIQGACNVCGGSGYRGNHLCECAIKFRVYNRLIDRGFQEPTLDFISSPVYELPLVESGGEFLNYFMHNPLEVLEKGLSLYIFSKENGRGKTTLAHYLAYLLVWAFSRTENYDTRRNYAFEDIYSLYEKDDRNIDDGMWRSTVLVLDDLGKESRSAKWKKENAISMLSHILYYRMRLRLPTIITSNFTPSKLSPFYDGILDSILEIHPEGALGGERFRQIELGGAEDLRLTNMKSEWPL